MYDYIKIAVHGQFDGVAKTVYSYPTLAEGEVAQWEKSLFDPTTIVKNFLNARECHVMWNNQHGRYFSLITRNPLDARAGYIMLTMLVENGYALTGRQIVSALVSLKKTLIEDGDRFDDAVNRCLESLNIPHTGMKLQSWDINPTSTDAKGMCYRTYVAGQELENIMSFPAQPEYTRYEKVIVISATASLRPNIHIERITSPVKKIFTVVAPEGVTASKSVVAEGERLQLTFSKAGFNPRKETVIAGVPSPYVRYEGSAIRVKSPAESGMGFVRKVRLVVKSAKGGLVTGYTINVNGHPVNTMEPYIELNEHEMQPGSKTEIHVASNNFRPLKVVKDSAELAKMDTLELELVPMEQGIVLRLDFGEGRVFEQEISIEKNTPEYSQLHSGNFHGFRAHRLNTPGVGEMYNVDVRSSSKPTAPTFTNVTSSTPTSTGRATAPVFENVSNGRGESAEKKEKGGILNTIKAMASGNRGGMLMGGALAVLVVILALVFILPKHNKDKEETAVKETAGSVEQTTTSTSVADVLNPSSSATTSTQAPATATTTAEQEDIKYLNENKTWELSQIKTPKYQALFNAIKDGDINAVANHDYFAVSGQATNDEAVKSVQFMWKALGTDNEGGNQAVMKKIVKNDRINIHDLYEELARRQPRNPNTTPRPSR